MCNIHEKRLTFCECWVLFLYVFYLALPSYLCFVYHHHRKKQNKKKTVYINDSLCFYNKNLWSKCKKLWPNKFIFGYWVSNGSVRWGYPNVHPLKYFTYRWFGKALFRQSFAKRWPNWGLILLWDKICWVLILFNLSVVYFCMGFIFYFWL